MGSPDHNLPAQAASFVGRQHELAEAKDALLGARLLTLTGVGGCGKTQLALHLASHVLPRFADGVWLVQLAPVTDPALVPRAVATALAVSGRADQSIAETLTLALGRRELLLVLDNCEHVIAACAELAETLVRGCPRVRILATSREPLRVAGEIVRRVPPLGLPAPELVAAPEALARVEAVRLFVERAHARQPEFKLTQDTAPYVADICCRLAGLPLAIELAAARLGAMSVQQIAQQLDHALRLLRGGSRTVPRQETMRATLEWSYALLSEAERALFRRLSVFVGDFGASAATHVGDDETDPSTVLDLLTSLVEKSLLEARVHGAEARYRILEPVRQYAWDQLVGHGEATSAQRKHAQFYAEFAEAAEPELMSAQRGAAIDRLLAEQDNLRAALNWCRCSEENADLELGLRLASALGWWWTFRGQISEGLDWSNALLDRDTRALAPRVLANALLMAGQLPILFGQHELARARLEASAALYQQLDDRRGLGYVLQALAMFVEPAEALRAASESLRLFREVGDDWGAAHATFSMAMARAAAGPVDASIEEVLVPWRALGDEWGIAEVLNFLGDVARSQRRDARAAELYEEALALQRKVGLTGAAPSLLHNLGLLALRDGDPRRAARLLRESLMLFRNQGDRPGIADCLEGLAGAHAMLGRPAQAGQLLGAADVLRETTGTRVWPANAADLARTLASIRDQLDEPALVASRAAGRSLSLEDVLAMVATAAEPPTPPTPPTPSTPAASKQSAQTGPLSTREREVAVLVARGFTNKEIASELVISERTASTHVAHILDKLGLRTRAQIAAWGVEHGLLNPPDSSRAGHPGGGPSVILRISGPAHGNQSL